MEKWGVQGEKLWTMVVASRLWNNFLKRNSYNYATVEQLYNRILIAGIANSILYYSIAVVLISVVILSSLIQLSWLYFNNTTVRHFLFLSFFLISWKEIYLYRLNKVRKKKDLLNDMEIKLNFSSIFHLVQKVSPQEFADILKMLFDFP